MKAAFLLLAAALLAGCSTTLVRDNPAPVRVADGVYGQWTYDAVRRFQRNNGLSVDGIAGPKTLKKLYGE